ncbi:hypothetical protein L6164_017929 [Bauhinia variegata]|uniref:Uncharacterized protein n=1 Tax=Bauhinia variegata TaxID=167791 RepID=A0ACB9NBJ9_BAUVA|nr:hypothetical protein L6164_017929 [Bauhinia variegata]
MASSSNYISMLAAILIIGTAMASAQETVSPAPTLTGDDEDVAPTSDETQKLLVKCAEEFSDKCGKEIYDGIFYNADDEHKSVSLECCKNLEQVGRKCHDELVNTMANNPEFASIKSLIIPRSVDVWNNCAQAVRAPAPSPY